MFYDGQEGGRHVSTITDHRKWAIRRVDAVKQGNGPSQAQAGSATPTKAMGG